MGMVISLVSLAVALGAAGISIWKGVVADRARKIAQEALRHTKEEVASPSWRLRRGDGCIALVNGKSWPVFDVQIEAPEHMVKSTTRWSNEWERVEGHSEVETRLTSPWTRAYGPGDVTVTWARVPDGERLTQSLALPGR